MVDDLCSLGRLGAYILTAWNAKEDHLDLLALARTHPGRRAIAERLHRFYTRCAEAGLPELERLATTVERSSTPGSPTLAPKAPTGSSRPSPATPTDSAPENQRLRTRCATTRRARGCLNPAYCPVAQTVCDRL
jgi:transposase